jgi:E3 ubiquitin-protein ligase UBR7
MDRVKAIEGVMAFNHLKEKLTPFFKKFAESGEVVSAEDVKNYFAQMRGDETGVKKEEEGEAVVSDGRKEQDGY